MPFLSLLCLYMFCASYRTYLCCILSPIRRRRSTLAPRSDYSSLWLKLGRVADAELAVCDSMALVLLYRSCCYVLLALFTNQNSAREKIMLRCDTSRLSIAQRGSRWRMPVGRADIVESTWGYRELSGGYEKMSPLSYVTSLQR